MRGWNKNVERSESVASGAQDIFKGDVLFARVPQPKRRLGERIRVSAFEEPEHERRIEQTNERGDAQDGASFARRRVREAEQLLGLAEEHLDGPATSICLENASDVERRVGAEEDTERQGACRGGRAIGLFVNT